MAGLRPKQVKRRLKIEELRGKGFTFRQIATKLKVSLKTVERDIAQLNDERDYMTPYVEERQKIRAEIDQWYREEAQRIVADWLEAKKGSTVTERTTRPFKFEVKAGQPSFDFLQVLKGLLGEEKAREMLDEYGLMVIETKREQLPGPESENPGPGELLEQLQYIEVTEKTFGPDWKAVASLHRALSDHLEKWAKFHGLQVETTRAHITTEEQVITGQIVLPEKVSIEMWNAMAVAHKQGMKPGVLTKEGIDAAAAQGVKLMEWNPEEGTFVPIKAKGK